MAPHALHFLLGAGLLAAMFVFAAAYRFALRECADPHPARPWTVPAAELPRASIHSGAARWTLGQHHQRAVQGVRVIQAGLVAAGITSVFVMGVCMLGIVGVAVFG